MQIKRPTGVTVLAILEFLGGLSSLYSGFTEIQAGGILTSLGYSGTDTIFYAFGVIAILLGLVSLAVGYGLWTGKGWAWMLAILFSVISILVSIAIAAVFPYGVFGAVVTIIVSLIVIYYLRKPNVREFFGKGVTPPSAAPPPPPPPPQ